MKGRIYILGNLARKDEMGLSTPKSNVKKRMKRSSSLPEFTSIYKNYLLGLNYSKTTIEPHLYRTKNFYLFFMKMSGITIEKLDDFQTLKSVDIKAYESYLIKRIQNKEIKSETAYSYLKNIRLFIQFLKHQNILSFDYSIPKNFVVQPTRSNVYIEAELITELIIGAYSDKSYRGIKTLTILLILVDTGCRLIELTNLRINEVNLIEKSISFHSIKSDKRTLQLNSLVINTIRDYLKERNEEDSNGNELFLDDFGEPSTIRYLSSLIGCLNMEVFGKRLINARALRHTYITNAIDNKNEIDVVASTVGHRHLESTMHYLHRSKKRLLLNTLEHDPLKNILEG